MTSQSTEVKSVMKESDIRPADIFREFLRLSARDAQRYFSLEARKAVPCPACGSKHRSPAFSRLGFDYVECDECTSLYLTPRPPLCEYERYYCDSPSANYWANTFFPSVVEQRREKYLFPG